MILKALKTTAIVLGIAVAAVIVVTVGAFIGTILLTIIFIGGMAFVLWFLWMMVNEG